MDNSVDNFPHLWITLLSNCYIEELSTELATGNAFGRASGERSSLAGEYPWGIVKVVFTMKRARAALGHLVAIPCCRALRRLAERHGV